MLQALASYDPGDPASRDVRVPDFSGELGKGVFSPRVSDCPVSFSPTWSRKSGRA